MKKKENTITPPKAFSLVEILVSLIIVSLIAAVFAPVMTKKLSRQKTSIANKMSTNCNVAPLDSDCKLCTTLNGQKKCLTCTKKCASNQFLDTATCSCKSCTGIESNCAACTSSKCIKCKEGYGLNSTGASGSSCSKCSGGNYSEGTTACKICPGGTYADSNNSSCLNCPAGSKCDLGIKTDCLNGQYSQKNSTECIDCPLNYYCPTKTAAVSCPSNSSTTSTKKTSISDCKCNKDFYNIYGSSVTSIYCTSCPSNSSTKNVVGATSVSQCKCDDGYYKSSTYTCSVCPVGSYCANGTRSFCTGNKTTGSTGSVASTDCNQCASGAYSSGSTCKQCNAGEYSDGGSCVTCPSGTISSSGATSCKQCSINTYANDDHTKCLTCPDGYYCANGVKSPCNVFGNACTKCDAQGCKECSKGTLENKVCVDCKKYGELCSKCNNNGCTSDGCASINHRYSIGGKYYCSLDFYGGIIKSGSTISSEVQLKNQGENCTSDKCCWKIANNRIVCNQAGAQRVCKNLNNKVLPTPAQTQVLMNLVEPASEYYNLELFRAIVIRGDICTQSNNSYGFSVCESIHGQCPSNQSDGYSGMGCYPFDIWGASYRLSLRGDKLAVVMDHPEAGFSVRCMPE